MTEFGSKANLANLGTHPDSDLKKKGVNASNAAGGANAANLIEKRRASLDVRHRYLLEKFSQYIDEKPAGLENSLLLGNKLEVLNDFFSDGGSRKVLFFWQAAGKVSWSFSSSYHP
jgi:dynein heavy chain